MTFHISVKITLLAGCMLLSCASDTYKPMPHGGSNLGEATAGTSEEGKQATAESAWDSNSSGDGSILNPGENPETGTTHSSRLPRALIYKIRTESGKARVIRCGHNPRCCYLKCEGPYFPLVSLVPRIMWMADICQCLCQC
ncbi:hypothetical protein Bbelb_325410 [Branchiostoma belcheri]|nr:hypothetical protein Bbelb_325410 [Branchiostoma belcheri]